MNNKDTICAIATPPGQGGIGVVRISGLGAVDVLKRIWQGKHPVESFESHKMYLGQITPPLPDPPPRGGRPALSGVEGVRVGVTIDTVLSVWMKAPNSYTGEDVVEISCHGGRTILSEALDACCKAGARLAEPGEFTKRAFLNGRMDLAQAEAVSDLIAATSDAAAKCAKNQLEGKLSGHIGSLMDELTKLRAFVEASIDFPEEDIEFIEQEGIEKRLAEIAGRMRALSNTYNEGRFIHDGVNVAIVGKPNVGKSSLFNALVGHERAIVHHTSGTTRDLVGETIQISGMAFHLTDAAGLRESEHDVEKIGIEKARDAIKRADLILFVLDGSCPIEKEDEEIYRSLDPKRTVVCVNKVDVAPSPRPSPARGEGVRKPPSPLTGEGEGGGDSALISALRGDGIESLKALLIQRVTAHKEVKTESVIITSARHKRALDEAIEQVENGVKAANEKKSAEFIAHHLSQTHEFLGRIVGKVSTEALLDEIFSRFCIGK